MRPVIADAKYFSGYLADPKNPITPFTSFAPFKPVLLQNASSDPVVDEHRISEAVPCFDQGQIGACVLNSWCGLLEMLLGIEGKTVTPLSRLFLYYMCRAAMSTIPQDSGTFPFLAANRLMNIGCIPETMWPYDPKLLSTKPTENTLDLYSAADDNKIKNAYRLDNPVTLADDIETCVLADHPVVIAVQVSNALMDAQPDDVLDPPDPKDVIGGHCLLATGRRKLRSGTRQWRIRNSYGVDYCDNGHVWFSEKYVLTSSDNWTGTRMDAVLV